MKTFSIKAITLAAVILTAPVQAVAQAYVPTPVTISTNKVKVDGKLCYSHIVLERQTIYSICKAYNVTAEDLYKFNPSLEAEGLKKNGIIIIPSQEALAEDKGQGKEKEATKEKKEQGKEKETITEEQKEVNKEEKNSKGEGKRQKHTVKWYETIEDIAEKYGVTVEAIMKENGMTEAVVKTRQKIFIPDIDSSKPTTEKESPKTEVETLAPVVTVTEIKDTTIIQADTTVITDTLPIETVIKPEDHIEIALILPLAATGTSSKRNYMDFYSGVLFGLHRCSNNGMPTNIRVFDNDGGEIPDSAFFAGCDVIIGPVYQDKVKNVLDEVSDSIMVVSPLDHRAIVSVKGNENFIQAPAHRTKQFEDLAEWIKSNKGEKDKVIYISETNTRDTLAVKEMKAVLEKSGLEYDEFSYTILQGRRIYGSLRDLMTKEGRNHFIIESESEAWVNDLVRNLNIHRHRNKITLYSPSKIRSFDSIDAESLYNISLHVSMSYNIDYDDPKVKDYLLKYRAIFHTEPSLFAYQGYDLITYFCQLISTYGNDWKKHLTDTTMHGLQATFQFEKTEDGGYINNGIRRVEYYPGGKSEIKQ